MKRVYRNFAELIGNTPLFRPQRWLELHGSPEANFAFKLEALNPSGSVKDRAALGMILDLEERGILKPGATIIEPTSGNTGVSLAALSASRGYTAILVLPDTMTQERRDLLQSYGARLVLTPGTEGMKGAIRKAEELQAEIPGAIIPSQFTNPANPAYHERSTGPEIWEQMEEKVDVLVVGVGTGGTLTGAGRYLRAKNPALEIIAVEPAASAVLSGEAPGKHTIQGIGAGFVPDVLDAALINRIIKVSDADARRETRNLAHLEGLLVGISSGAALAACATLLQDENYRGKTIVTVLPDSGDRYLSTGLFTRVD